MTYLVHLSDITCIAGDQHTAIRVFWHKHMQKIVLEHNNHLYPLSCKNHHDLTVRQLLHAIGWNEQSYINIQMDATKAYEHTMEDILDGDLWNTIYHEIYLEMPPSIEQLG